MNIINTYKQRLQEVNEEVEGKIQSEQFAILSGFHEAWNDILIKSITEDEEPIQCEECHDSGVVDKMNCYKDSNECCGGCYKEIECEECNGTGVNENKTEFITNEINEFMDEHNVTKEQLITIIKNI